jgi:hypothetical protein
MIRPLPVLATVALALGATACSSAAAHSANSGKKSSTTTVVTVAPGVPETKGFLRSESTFGTSSVGAPDPTTTVPTERGTRHIDPNSDAGQQVIIAEGSYLLPEWLVANVALPITWTNLSGAPQQIVFDDGGVVSPVIPQGGTFTWKSPGFGVSLTYHTTNGHHAQLTLQNPNIAP